MESKKKTVMAVIFTAIITFIITVVFCASLAVRLTAGGTSLTSKISAVNTILDEHYLYDYDTEELEETAVTAYVEGLDEPYTHYYSPDEFSSYIGNIQDGYVGIGVVVGVSEDNRIIVISPFEDSPAFEAGIESGDILKAVDGVEYSGDKLNEAVNVIKGGKEGTEVTLTLIRGEEELEITVERRNIDADSVKTEMLDDNIGYMRITSFNMQSESGDRSTYSEFAEKLSELKENGMEKLVIDLRDNPGGVLTEVCDIADALLGEGVITYTETKDGERKYYNSDENAETFPIVVLINGGSASASEVLTGALMDSDRAVSVGEKTYGKGIVQEVYPFSDGSGISVTSAKYYTPSGVCIHGEGITPDYAVEPRDDTPASLLEHNEDVQLQKALEIIREK